MQNKKLDRRTWLKHARGWKKSGLRCKDYAEREGLSASSLSWWTWRLRSEGEDVPGGRGAGRGGGRKRRATKETSKRLPFVELEPWSPAADAASVGKVELEAGGVVLRVEPGFDEGHLARVLAVVEARR